MGWVGILRCPKQVGMVLPAATAAPSPLSHWSSQFVQCLHPGVSPQQDELGVTDRRRSRLCPEQMEQGDGPGNTAGIELAALNAICRRAAAAAVKGFVLGVRFSRNLSGPLLLLAN